MIRPVVKRVDRFIPLPKAISSVLRPIQRVKPSIVPPKVAVRRPPANIKPMAAAVPAVRLVRPKALPGRHGRAQPKRPPVLGVAHHREPDAQSLQRLKELRGSGAGRALVIVANGPSIIEASLEKLRNLQKVDLMSINRPDDRVWPTKYWLFCDTSQYHRHRDRWEGYQGILFNTIAIPPHRNSVHIRHITGSGFSRDLVAGFHIGRSSVFAAMQVALWLNYDMIYIFGVDMRSVQVDGREMVHFYGANPDVQPENRIKRFADEARHYDLASSVLSNEIRQRFCFCSSYLSFPFADRFCRLDHKEAVGTILQRWN